MSRLYGLDVVGGVVIRTEPAGGGGGGTSLTAGQTTAAMKAAIETADPTPENLTTTDTTITTAGAQTVAAGAVSISIFAKTGSFTYAGTTFDSASNPQLVKPLLPKGEQYPALNFTIVSGSVLLEVTRRP